MDVLEIGIGVVAKIGGFADPDHIVPLLCTNWRLAIPVALSLAVIGTGASEGCW